jgi:NAD(P)H-dependent flavin oxidoreductase YrpB (nitropropane dioxygenase family)
MDEREFTVLLNSPSGYPGGVVRGTLTRLLAQRDDKDLTLAGYGVSGFLVNALVVPPHKPHGS